MIYGGLNINYETGSLSTTKKKEQIIRHYSGTDKSDCFPLGRQPTIIKCNAMVSNDEDRILLEQVCHDTIERELHFGTFFYKRVITGDSVTPKYICEDTWYIPIEFIALDPTPYDETSGEALY